jgi:prepilin-type N-terminal cleavage/methylation domain-containing protein
MKKNGFTLIELLIVVIIIVLFSGIGVTAFIRRQEAVKGSGEVRELVNDLRYAKQISIAEQIHYGVVFDFNEDSYRIVNYDQDREVIKEKIFDPQIDLRSIDNYSEVKFTLFGAVFKKGGVILNGKNFEEIINIKPSGFIHVQGDNLN